MLEELEMDGVWGACLQPRQGLFWYRLANSELLCALCRAYNGWVADFCQAAPDRLKGVGMLNVDDRARIPVGAADNGCSSCW